MAAVFATPAFAAEATVAATAAPLGAAIPLLGMGALGVLSYKLIAWWKASTAAASAAAAKAAGAVPAAAEMAVAGAMDTVAVTTVSTTGGAATTTAATAATATAVSPILIGGLAVVAIAGGCYYLVSGLDRGLRLEEKFCLLIIVTA